MDDGEERRALLDMIIVPSIPIMVLKDATITMIVTISKDAAVDEDSHRPPTGKRRQGGKKTHAKKQGS